MANKSVLKPKTWKDYPNGYAFLSTCNCENSAQDEIHGFHYRVFNIGGKNGKKIARCTGCGFVKS